jgi:hypothetical protein
MKLALPAERLAGTGGIAVHQHVGFRDTYREMQFLNVMQSKGQAPRRVWN